MSNSMSAVHFLLVGDHPWVGGLPFLGGQVTLEAYKSDNGVGREGGWEQHYFE